MELIGSNRRVFLKQVPGSKRSKEIILHSKRMTRKETVDYKCVLHVLAVVESEADRMLCI